MQGAVVDALCELCKAANPLVPCCVVGVELICRFLRAVHEQELFVFEALCTPLAFGVVASARLELMKFEMAQFWSQCFEFKATCLVVLLKEREDVKFDAAVCEVVLDGVLEPIELLDAKLLVPP